MSSGSSILQKPSPLGPIGQGTGVGLNSTMTGVGQRMPSQAQQAIILRPGQQTGLVTLASAQGQRPTAVLVNTSNSPGIRVQAPGIQTRPGTPASRNVLINQSGTQISVPISALQSMQAGKKMDYFHVEIGLNSLLFFRPRHTHWAGRPPLGQD